jgi:hypothetical protein
MAGEQIVEQAPQTAEVMPADPTNNVQAEQPVSALFMRPPYYRFICGEQFPRTDG